LSQPPFSSVALFRQTFSEGLRQLLSDAGIGAYILVHANACFDPELMQQLRPHLVKRFMLLASRCRGGLREGRELEGAADDAAVFLRLMAIGFEGVAPTRFRALERFEVQFNPLRALRPRRMTGETVEGISRPFNASGFHFNKPFLQREIFWSGELLGQPVDLLYNKFPFVPMHGLLVPQREAQHPQYLTRHYHDYVWQLCETLGEKLPGWGMGYNSYGAYASVNHLHFQTFVRETGLPVTSPHWQHRGGGQPYPLPCEVYDSRQEAWQCIAQLHDSGDSYNLIYLPGELYCLPRRRQGSCPVASWSSGFAWYELAGGVITPDRKAFEALDDERIAAELAKLALNEAR
jgi:ATP adenylyltransferase/5',5'''-P-1,P-4-tetraphosphate phosphorylase II